MGMLSMVSGLHGHVNIEEHRVFPSIKRALKFSDSDVKYLYECHEELDTMENKLDSVYRKVINKKQKKVAKEDVLEVMKSLVQFDRALMQHLGEEEEFITPVELMATKCGIHY